jgi:hypothetical protein
MRILMFLGFLALSMLVPVGLAQADSAISGGPLFAETFLMAID